MRRAGVRPWLAAAGATAFLLFGFGYSNIVRAFQVSFDAALLLGLCQLLLADHEGPIDRRDWFGLVCGAIGLMCSGIAITTTFVVGVAALIRRPARRPCPSCRPARSAVSRLVGAVRGAPVGVRLVVRRHGAVRLHWLVEHVRRARTRHRRRDRVVRALRYRHRVVFHVRRGPTPRRGEQRRTALGAVLFLTLAGSNRLLVSSRRGPAATPT